MLISASLGVTGCEKSSGPSALEEQKQIENKQQDRAQTEKKEPPASNKSDKEATVTETATVPVASAPASSATGASRPDANYTLQPISACSEDSEVLDAIKALRKTGKERSMREEFQRLKKEGKPAIAGLLASLSANNPNVRAQSALILRRMEHRSLAFTNALNAMLLSDPDADVRGIAGRVMVYYLEKKTVPALIEALSKDTNEAVRMHAAWALGAIKDKKALPALFAALKDTSTDVRLRTVGALKRIRSKKALPHLVPCLEDPNTLVRTRALEALKKLSGKKLGKDVSRWRARYPLRK